MKHKEYEKGAWKNEIMKATSTPFPSGIPPTYGELVGVLAPRAIHDAVEFKNASEISGRELGRILGNEAAGGFVLRGERSITVDQAKKLGARFSVDPSLFLDL
jgi:hypothetical protein